MFASFSLHFPVGRTDLKPWGSSLWLSTEMGPHPQVLMLASVSPTCLVSGVTFPTFRPDNALHIGKGIEFQKLSGFPSQSGKIEKYLQITSNAVKGFREGSILYSIETTWQSPLALFELCWHLACSLHSRSSSFFPRCYFPDRLNLYTFSKQVFPGGLIFK